MEKAADLTEREMRALAAIAMHSGFGPWAKGDREQLTAALAKKGLVNPPLGGSFGIATLTEAGHAAFKHIHIQTYMKRAEDWSPFEQELNLRISRQSKSEWDKLERELPNEPAPPRSEMH